MAECQMGRLLQQFDGLGANNCGGEARMWKVTGEGCWGRWSRDLPVCTTVARTLCSVLSKSVGLQQPLGSRSTPPTMVGFLSGLPTNLPAGHSSSLQGWPISAGSWSKEMTSEFSPVLQTQYFFFIFFFHSNVFLSPFQEGELQLADQQQLAKQTAVMTSVVCCVQPL